MNETEPAPRLSISMVHHNGLLALDECMASLLQNPPSCSYEIIIVDNVSTDGARDMLRSRYPAVCLIENETRKGFGENQNTGIRASRGEYILLLNDDTIIHEGAFDCLVAYLDSHPESAVVGPRLLNGDGSLQVSCYRFPSPLRRMFENLLFNAAFPNHPIVGDHRSWPHDTERDVEYVSGAALLVRRSVIDRVGLFDTRFFMYAEEADWQKRMHADGWKVSFCPSSVITHLGGQSSTGMKDRQFCEFNRSQVKFIRKHYGVWGAAVQRVAMLIGACLRLAIWGTLRMAPAHRAAARKQLALWSRLLRWWLGLGPNAGLSDL